MSTVSTSEADLDKPSGLMGPLLYQMVREGRAFSGHERNCCFLNLGQGKFADVSAVSGFDFPDDGRAIAQCDWDHDGDLDLWIANRSGPQLRFLRNDLRTPHHFLSIRLEGKTCNRDAIGARVVLTLQEPKAENGNPVFSKTLRAGEGFLAQSSKRIHFGLGSATEIKTVVVHWPGGAKEQFDGLEVDRHYRLVEHTGKAEPRTPTERKPLPRHSDQSQQSSAAATRVVAPAPVPLPQLDYETLYGEKRRVGQPADGRPVLVNLWASWCRPCLVELKEFGEREAELRKAGVTVLALSVDRLDTDKGSASHENSSNAAGKLLKNVGFKGESGWATAAAIDQLQLVEEHLFDLHQRMAVPTSLLIDSAGRLAVLYRGPVSVDQLLADVSQLPDIASSQNALPFPGRWHTRRQPLSLIDIAWKLVDHGYLDTSIDYITTNRSLLEDSPLYPRLLLLVGNHLIARGETKRGLSFYHDSLKSKPDFVKAQNNLAWVLATHPDQDIRNGTEAISHISSAVKASPANAFRLLDTLAAAYAEDRQFDKAVATAQQAIEIANSEGHQGFARGLEARLQLYQSEKPYRDK